MTHNAEPRFLQSYFSAQHTPVVTTTPRGLPVRVQAVIDALAMGALKPLYAAAFVHLADLPLSRLPLTQNYLHKAVLTAPDAPIEMWTEESIMSPLFPNLNFC